MGQREKGQGPKLRIVQMMSKLPYKRDGLPRERNEPRGDQGGQPVRFGLDVRLRRRDGGGARRRVGKVEQVDLESHRGP